MASRGGTLGSTTRGGVHPAAHSRPRNGLEAVSHLNSIIKHQHKQVCGCHSQNTSATYQGTDGRYVWRAIGAHLPAKMIRGESDALWDSKEQLTGACLRCLPPSQGHNGICFSTSSPNLQGRVLIGLFDLETTPLNEQAVHASLGAARKTKQTTLEKAFKNA